MCYATTETGNGVIKCPPSVYLREFSLQEPINIVGEMFKQMVCLQNMQNTRNSQQIFFYFFICYTSFTCLHQWAISLNLHKIKYCQDSGKVDGEIAQMNSGS